jgi:ABC-type branched-subunit amino acid transport system ATPase component
VHLNGCPIQGLPPQRVCQQGLARSFQITDLFEGLTIHESVRLSLALSATMRLWSGRGWRG